jgi:hypothetical protein
LAAASVNLSTPFLNLPFDTGVKVTETEQLADAGIALVHPLLPRPKPAPVTLTSGAGNSTSLWLVRLTIRGMLRVPAGTLPKLILRGESASANLFLARDGLGCALARPSSTHKAAQIAITTPVTRRGEITRRDIPQLAVCGQ